MKQRIVVEYENPRPEKDHVSVAMATENLKRVLLAVGMVDVKVTTE